MRTAELLADGFGRVHTGVHAVLDGLGDAALTARLDGEANTIAWLCWHLTRVQDDHVAEVAGVEQRWTAGGFADRFSLALEPGDTGYGHTPAQVAAVVASGADLLGYHDAVFEVTDGYVRRLTDGDLDRIVDERWDPPVSLGVRLVSVIDDDLEHVGQAALVRGLLERR